MANVYVQKSNALSNLELIDIIKHRNLEKHFGGVYSKDLLPELIKDKFYIVNLQDHDDGGVVIGQRFIIIIHQLQYILIVMDLLHHKMYKKK